MANRSILDAGLCPERASAGACNTACKIQTDICPWQQAKMESF